MIDSYTGKPIPFFQLYKTLSKNVFFYVKIQQKPNDKNK